MENKSTDAELAFLYKNLCIQESVLQFLKFGQSHFTSPTLHERFIEERKANYCCALNKSQKEWEDKQEQIDRWLLFFLETIDSQSRQALNIIGGESMGHLLLEKQLALCSWAKGTQDKTFSRQDAMQALDFLALTVESIIKKLHGPRRLEMLGRGY